MNTLKKFLNAAKTPPRMKNSSLKYTGIVILAFIWISSLTYNFNFFWEDAYILGQYNIYLQQPELFSTKNIASLFIDAVIRPEQFSSVNYGWKPLQEGFIYQFMVKLSGNNVLFHRTFKATLYAGLVLLYFCFLKHLSSNYDNRIKNKTFLFLSFSTILLLPEIWTAQLYLVDTLILTLLFSTTALFIFYFYYDKYTNYLTPFLFIFIMILTQLSTVTKHVGRLNVAIITLFLLFTQPKKILQKKYAILLSALFFISFPVLGFLSLISGESTDILGISSHTSQNTLYPLIFSFFKTIHHAFIPHTIWLLGLLSLSFILHIFGTIFIKKQQKNNELKKLVIFSFFWFVFTAFAMHMARGFIFDPKFFLRFEFTLFLFPQMLFVLSYTTFVYKKYFTENKIIPLIIFAVLILAVITTGLRLNEWRGGWGAYFLGYDTAREYVDSISNNSILLVRMDHAAPTYFVSNNTILMTADLTNQSLLEELQRKYKTVFIADRQQLKENKTIIHITDLSIKDNSPYGKLKKLANREYTLKMKIYKFVKNTKASLQQQ